MSQVHIYVATGFEEVELITVADILRRSEIPTQLISLNEQLNVVGAHAISICADLPFSAASDQPELIILPGGGPGTQAMLQHHPLHQRLISQIDAGKRLAAICAAPMVLAQIGLLANKNACCFPGCEAQLLAGQAQITAFNVVTDGLITTSRGPATAALFALELVRQLKDDATAQQVGKAMLYL
ncbi:DJ-1/PfpI family protein [Chitinibacter fontanus]|uniref:DJ-1/PfpI family protein n=1 Tax=Chitinibacter fontanus TaxID=1737446 RepID=A0A7D5Z3R3_9NEIS|nr:DJ-1 family glyoxalase III [Chitinibacter fontanus]QLI80182.1 DJ-1/PfpI family protein [Chitinibacter fontanus]